VGKIVVSNATLACTMGTSPGSLTVQPANKVNAGEQPIATIMEHKSLVNISSFGLCLSPANPRVAAATAAAQGVLTPQPCIPSTGTPWSPGCLSLRISDHPALNDTSLCNCLWAGVISISSPGQMTVEVS
jgi:hypothetical protein